MTSPRSSMRISLGAALLMLPFAAAPALSQAPQPQDRPQTLPSRDVDITYRLGQINPATAPRIIEQRMRWDITGGRLRVDPPTPGLYVILDTHTHNMTTVRESDHTVVELDGMGGPNAPVPGSPPVDNGIPFIREGESQVASLTCTEWETKDISGAPALVCITDDGVLLRAVTAGRTVLEATKVSYGPIDPSVFQVPTNYVRLHPPPPAH